MVTLSGGRYFNKFLYSNLPFHTTFHQLLSEPHEQNCTKRLRRQFTMTTTDAAVGNTGPRDHLQVTSSQQRDAESHQMTVVDITDISPTVKKLVLLTDVCPIPFSFKAGQWVDVFIPGIEKVGGFSMTSSPTYLKQTGKLHLAVKSSDHIPARWVHTQCKVGSTLAVRVGGDFFIDFRTLSNVKDDENRILLLAGGVGINPLTSMVAEMQDFTRAQPEALPRMKSALLFSARTTQEFLFRDEFDAATSANNFKPLYFLTGESQPQGPLDFIRGRIDPKILERIIAEHLNLKSNTLELSEKLQVYICGPPQFITSLEASLASMGTKKIFFENWWKSPSPSQSVK